MAATVVYQLYSLGWKPTNGITTSIHGPITLIPYKWSLKATYQMVGLISTTALLHHTSALWLSLFWLPWLELPAYGPSRFLNLSSLTHTIIWELISFNNLVNIDWKFCDNYGWSWRDDILIRIVWNLTYLLTDLFISTHIYFRITHFCIEMDLYIQRQYVWFRIPQFLYWNRSMHSINTYC